MRFLLILPIIMLIYSCKRRVTYKNNVTETTISGYTKPPSHPTWIDSGKVILELDTVKSQNQLYELADSALIVHYKGSDGEIEYDLINEEGKWLDRIYAIKKLTKHQLKKFITVFGDSNLTYPDFTLCCYYPKFGIVFFSNGNVIAYTSFSIKNSKVNSTASLSNGKHYAAFDSSFNNVLIKTLKESKIEIN